MNQPIPTATTHTAEGHPAMYAPAVIPDTLATSYAGIFWAAANRIASTPHSPDVLTNAISAAAPKPHHARTIEQLAVNRAQKLHPTAINPHNPPTRWTWWQQRLPRLQAWTILATLAEQYSDHKDTQEGLTAGTWKPAETLQ